MIVNIPTLETIFTSSTETATSMFNFGWPYMVIGLGIFLGALLVVWFKDSIINIFEYLFSKESKRKRRMERINDYETRYIDDN